VEFPQVFIHEDPDTEELAAKELAEHVTELGITSPFVIASAHGAGVTRTIDPEGGAESVAPGADQEWAAAVGSRAQRAGADAIVAAGGGRTLDVAKLAAARAGLVLIAVPTQLSHDGICSPVAVVPDETGRTESLGAIAPRAVFVSIPTLVGAPPASVAAGIGDLLANPLALKDWALAAGHGLDEIDRRAWDMSVEAYEAIEADLDKDAESLAADPGFLRRLADALIHSGMAMIVSGTSRPASGGEHEISHALEEIYGSRAMHGAQVAFGCIVSMALYDDDHKAFRERLTKLGLPQHPDDLRLTQDELVRVLLHAPDTRPGRFTILEDANLDEMSARSLIERIWGNG
jgi:glycerol-1-phosphate dehydrogenase [NAD(P)+]